jgi:hypothetical protein
LTRTHAEDADQALSIRVLAVATLHGHQLKIAPAFSEFRPSMDIKTAAGLHRPPSFSSPSVAWAFRYGV